MFAQLAQSSHIVRRGRVGQLAAFRAGIPLAHRCRRALRGTRSRTVVVPASSPSSPVQNPRKGLLGVAARPGALPARVHACRHAWRRAWQRFRSASG
eukprot:47796-Pyramimonas_sp.AAC.1